MLGEGIVSFGVTPPAVSVRNLKWSPKIVSPMPSLPSIFRAAGVNSIVPSGLWNWTSRSSSAREIPSIP